MGIEYGERRSTFIDYGRPSLFLDFAKRKSLVDAISKNNLITFTRSSTGTYVGSDGLIKTAAADEARFDHDPETGESLGLLIEEQRTNLIPFSESFGLGSQWNTIRATVTQNQITAPDGTLTADLLEPIVTTSGGYTRFYYNVTSGTTYTFSVFVKYHSSDFPYVNFFAGYGTISGGSNSTFFNIQNGTLGSGSGTTYVSHSIKDYGNGWYRCSMTTTADVTGSVPFVIHPAEGNNDISYVSDGVGGIYIWGAQIEAGSFPTSYIPTSGSAVTRQPDNTYITGTNFTGFYNQTEGTVFSKFNAFNVGLGDGGRLFRVVIGNNSGGNRIDYVVTQVGAYQPYLASGNVVYYGGASAVGFSKNTNHKIALTLKENDITGYVDGSLSTSDTSFIPFVADKFEIGNYLNGGHLNGHISQLLYYPTRLTNTQLQALTQ